jgi:hypothetical protein
MALCRMEENLPGPSKSPRFCPGRPTSWQPRKVAVCDEGLPSSPRILFPTRCPGTPHTPGRSRGQNPTPSVWRVPGRSLAPSASFKTRLSEALPNWSTTAWRLSQRAAQADASATNSRALP